MEQGVESLSYSLQTSFITTHHPKTSSKKVTTLFTQIKLILFKMVCSTMELYKVNKSCFLAFKVLVGSCTGQLFLSVALQQQTHPFWEESISVEKKNSNNYFEPTIC
jgi:hypothetical protein